MKIRIIEAAFATYYGPMASLQFENGVSTTDASPFDIQRIAGCIAICDADDPEQKQIDLSMELAAAKLGAVAEPIPLQHPTEEQFKEMQAQALKERVVNQKADEYGAILSEDNIVDDSDADDLIIDPEQSPQGSDGGNGFNGTDDDDEEDMSDLMAAEQAAIPAVIAPVEAPAEEITQQDETGAGEGESTIEQVAETPAAEFVADGDAPSEGNQQSAPHIYTREELEVIADKDGIAGLRLISEPMEVRSKKITELIDGILKAQAN